LKKERGRQKILKENFRTGQKSAGKVLERSAAGRKFSKKISEQGKKMRKKF